MSLFSSKSYQVVTVQEDGSERVNDEWGSKGAAKAHAESLDDLHGRKDTYVKTVDKSK